MHPALKYILLTATLCASYWIGSTAAAAEPSELSSVTFTRTAAPADLKATLTKNFYHQVPYQSEYDVQIPYQVEVAYTDYEDQTSSEYVCHDRIEYRQECHYEQRCTTIPGSTMCRNENRCYTVPGSQMCRNVNDCRTVPGSTACRQVCGNGQYNPRTGQTEPSGCQQVCETGPSRQECSTRQVCEQGPSRQQCDPQQVCETGPSRQQCNNEQVCNNVPVTKQDCGYETVHHSVPVQRTRMETRYRSETRCCETRYRAEFDHQSAMNVVILVPAEATLEKAEKEVFTVTMTDENKVSLSIGSTVYGYKIASSDVSGQQATFKLEIVPKYSADELGDKTITGTAFTIGDKGSSVSFNDSGLRNKVRSSYQISIFEKTSMALVEKSAVVAATDSAKVSIAMKQNFSADVEYLARVSVQREGLVLARTVQFSKDFTRAKDPMKTEQYDGRVVAIPKIQGVGAKAHLVFKDGAPDNGEVTTQYTVKITVMGGFLNLSKKVLAEKTLSSAQAPRSKAQIVDVMLTKLGLSADDLNSKIKSGAKIWIDVTVQRKGARLNNGKALVFTRSFAGTL